jgi:hypothetical protein
MLSFSQFLTERAGSGIRATKERAYNGKQEKVRRKASKYETGQIGERVVMHHLQKTGHKGVHALNGEGKGSNYPVDVATRHHLVEVKTGHASNHPGMHRWRATIGEPGKKEKEWLKTAHPDAKRKWNHKKAKAIMDRKHAALKEHSKKHGVKMSGKTYGVILHHDKKIADVHEYHGFHHSISWKHPDTHKHYVGSYKYE